MKRRRLWDIIYLLVLSDDSKNKRQEAKQRHDQRHVFHSYRHLFLLSYVSDHKDIKYSPNKQKNAQGKFTTKNTYRHDESWDRRMWFGLIVIWEKMVMMITCQVALRIRMNPSKGSAFTSVRKILVDLFISLFIIKADYSEKIRYLSTSISF